MSNLTSIKNDTQVGRILKYEGTHPPPSIPNRNFASFMLEIIAQHGKKVAVVDTVSEETCTYDDLRRAILSTHNSLTNAGLRKGDVVILLPETYCYYYAHLFGVMLCGAIAVSCRADMTKEELVHRLRVTGAKWVITVESAVNNVEAAFQDLGADHLKKMWIIGKASGKDLISSKTKNSDSIVTVDDNFDAATTCALMFFSSGTTGLPKGVKISHKSLLVFHHMFRHLDEIEQIPQRSFSGSVSLLPFTPVSSFGYTISMQVLSKGYKAVLLKKYVIKEYLQAIQRYKATYLMMVPHMIKELVASPITEKFDLTSVVAATTGSAPIDNANLDSFKKKMNVYVTEGYGLTETTSLITFNGTQMGFKPGSVGTPIPFFEVKVVDPVTGCLLSEGHNGEICTRGPYNMMGYANNPEATASAFDAEGWFHTGDIGYYDKDSFIYLTDRVKDIIKVEGKTVYPSEIEALIEKMEEVHEVAVVGVPDDKAGELPRAWVVPKLGVRIDKEALIKFVAEHASHYNRLRGGVEIVKSLPRSSRGKVLKRQLQDSYVAAVSQQSTK
ncbi:hypothetical protein SK128_020329 [Halocaridina rubra]|uniref:Uncharacterized protein n=1 Tax=Halocaridina rubra TaxID=373956 RepID=A0AAN8X5M3_HALRR